jgi:amino acid transporter
MARELGSMPRVLMVWLGAGVVVLLGSFCYAELGAAMPEAGGEYIYLTRGHGPLWGFSYASFHTPNGAVSFLGCVAILLVLTGTYQELYSLTVFAIGIFYGLTAFALVRLRVTQPLLLRPYGVWGYPWTPLIFGTAAFATSVNLILVRPLRSSIGLAVMLRGIPFFRSRSKRVP